MNDFLPYIKPTVVSVAIMGVILAVKSAYSVYKDSEDKRKTSEDELEKLSAKPVIDLVVKDTFILPFDGTAQCFIRLSLHNTTDVPSGNPSDYDVTLTIKGKEYQNASFLDLREYRLRLYKMTMGYDDSNSPREEEQRLSDDEMPDIRTKTTDLKKGTRVEGWLGFAVHYVPPWESDKEYLGQHYEKLYDEEMGWVHEVLIDDFHVAHHTRTVEEVKLTMVDAYGQEKTVWIRGPFTKHGQRVIPPQNLYMWD